MTFVTALFIIILAGMGLGAISEISKAIVCRGAAASELAKLKRQLEEYAAALEDAQTTLAAQAGQLEELQERVDFAERLLTQARERSALGAGSRRE